MEKAQLIEPAPAARRHPSQKRSRERFERILAVATEVIEAAGSDQMKMSDIASRAGISIGSLYQYFPDKAAIIRTLAEHYNAIGRDCISEALESVTTTAELERAFTELVDTYYAMFLAEPVMRDIWSGMQADKMLSDLDLDDARENGDLLAGAMMRVAPHRDRQEVRSAAFLIMHLGEATMRLALQVGEDEGRRLVEDYKRMVLREMTG
ncbi:TetR/AcrR family transcriptional regulator [Nitratireductor sp. ZSWI3]|uniref:TetR/AcrR family transcriptional regulator n=1 Tax=Nitratireductor sp. ZSWI3 TaxID=2966359 RepID=UPI0021506668|nr:TetR/AcrR family transcriptional regulator [Nitratireductor sp. ZSWI3]MCR4265599.1 TetR family transcriptional regulator [Nitratireductor sp. ZSWI3]